MRMYREYSPPELEVLGDGTLTRSSSGSTLRRRL